MSKKIVWSYNWILLHLVPIPLVVSYIFQLHFQIHLIQNLAFTVFAFLSPSPLAPCTLSLYSFQAFTDFSGNASFHLLISTSDRLPHPKTLFPWSSTLFAFLGSPYCLSWAKQVKICQEAATCVPDCLHLLPVLNNQLQWSLCQSGSLDW